MIGGYFTLLIWPVSWASFWRYNSSYFDCRYCSTVAPPVLTSTENVMHIKFVSDANVGNEGFSASYVALNASTSKFISFAKTIQEIEWNFIFSWSIQKGRTDPFGFNARPFLKILASPCTMHDAFAWKSWPHEPQKELKSCRTLNCN